LSFPYKVVRHEKSHESAEDYLENILILRERNGNVRSIDIVNEMNYSKPSISIAMKKLRTEGYVEMDLNGYITLTESGEEIAQRIYSRHQLLEKVLVAIGVDQETLREHHYLTIVQIMEQLDKDYGISTSRGTVGDDIKALQELGVEIVVESSTQKRYYMIGRRFDLPELKTMIDAIESARFIPKEKSAALVKKIGSLTSFHNTEKLVRNVDVENRIKADNEKVYYIMEALNDAINSRKKVSFQYFTFNVRKEQKLRHDGYTYVFSPFKLIWNSGS
jgi:Mn-dependent transcriptional regulator